MKIKRILGILLVALFIVSSSISVFASDDDPFPIRSIGDTDPMETTTLGE